MLLVWDNRCLVHAATGGYEGHRRLLHRITIGERAAPSAAPFSGDAPAAAGVH
jgi:taurine dioxygenase